MVLVGSNYIRTLFQLCALIVLSSAADFYKLLGISRSASHKEIKKAYRSKSLEFHPDKNKSEGAADQFSEIARAYEVLSDETLKEVYDQQGEEGLKRHEEHGGMGGGGGGFGGGDPFSDMFENHFGFGGGGGRGRNDSEPRTDSIQIPLTLSLKQLYNGVMLDLLYYRDVLCTNWEECMRKDQGCSGPGVKIMRQQIAPGFVQQVEAQAPHCVSRGKAWRSNCKACPSGKTETEKINLSIDVTKGMRDGERISFEGVTDEKPGFLPGDLHFMIKATVHEDYHRQGDSLYITREIPLVDALTGFTIDLKHVDGHVFAVVVDGVTECDHVMRVPGKGMPRRNGRGMGDLYITFEVDFPDSLTQAQISGIRSILAPENDEL